jgi:hypothetical protein
MRRAIFTTLPVFMSYAGMISLQANIKHRLNIGDKASSRGDTFGAGVAMLYFGNLCFRIGHNFLFTFLTPRNRAMLSYFCLCIAHLTIGFAYWVADSDNLCWVFIAYLLAGIGIGSFESNLLSTLSPFGHGTKSWAVLGVSIGFNGVSVGFFLIFAIWPHHAALEGAAYFFIAGASLLGALFLKLGIPHVEFASSNDNAKKFYHDLKLWRDWLPHTWKHTLALCVDMFCVSMFSSIVYYVYNVEDVPIVPGSETTVPKNVFQVVYNLCAFLGDFSGRKIAYHDKYRNPLFLLNFSIIGGACVLSKVAVIAPVGIFCVMFANGLIYAHTTKHIDNAVDDTYNLIALSVWLFVGDVGSLIAAYLVQPFQAALGPVRTHVYPAGNNSTIDNTSWVVNNTSAFDAARFAGFF